MKILDYLTTEKLLPHKLRKLGFPFVAVGALALYFYFKGQRPAFLETPTFAFVSTYLENRYFTIIQTNWLDEIGFVFIIKGLLLITLTEEKIEKPHYNPLRFKAFVFSIKITFLLWILLYLTTFGYAVFVVSMFMVVIFLVIYYLRFGWLKQNSLQTESDSETKT